MQFPSDLLHGAVGWQTVRGKNMSYAKIVHRVVLASPNDVGKEREIARSVIEEIRQDVTVRRSTWSDSLNVQPVVRGSIDGVEE